MAYKAPKMTCYSTSKAADYRTVSTVCTKNDGDSYLITVNKLLSLSPGKHTKYFIKKNDKFREKRTEKANLISSKLRRIFLAKKREAERRAKERSEGIQYKSNCETSGFQKTADILQIAAKFEEYTFNVYLNPSQSFTMDDEASKVIGLKNIFGKIYLNDKQVSSILPKEALQAFQKFLNLSQKPCILVAHNARFDSGHLLRAIINNNMIESFKNIAGISDSLSLF
ncbi:PREDICTED: uncharacterized protein LOC105458979, partial [Wasmannia auropunctata]|uniref:uncharacterized protein LOC105458979 n=1 Tax=Wasmannia auropunctata TaxID=64793 RepID=UPI0005EF9B59